MEVEIVATTANAIIKAHPSWSRAADMVEKLGRYGAKSIEVQFDDWDATERNQLYAVAQSVGDRSLMTHLSAIAAMEADPESTTPRTLQALVEGLYAYLGRNFIDGWLYERRKDGIIVPWLVTEIKHHPKRRDDDKPSVSLSMIANTAAPPERESYNRRAEIKGRSLRWQREDLAKTTLPKLLADSDFFHETPALRAEYDKHLALFREYVNRDCQQFLATGTLTFETDYWSRECTEAVHAKVVNDEGLLSRRFIEAVPPPSWFAYGKQRKARSGKFVRARTDESTEAEFDAATTPVDYPFHCFVYCFHLELHRHTWVYVTQMEPYVYDKTLASKLVLPPEHRDLIDVLTSDLDVILDDVIVGKGGGTTILCKGAPGLGKTLTAEIYSEVTERVLYRVHSGQLGVTSEEVEKCLKVILGRAQRWSAVLLIDEADVYVRQRGDDLDHNAVVASFLRTMEYFSGLLFMTTNRPDDVDDAILSRCIAVVSYDYPQVTEQRAIWTILAKQFNVELSSDLISDIVEHFTSEAEAGGKKISGRDVKELLKLASRYIHLRKIEPSVDLFRKCAQFRGL